MNQERGFATALAAAELSDAPRTARKMGSALFCGSRILSIGYNRYHSHPDSDNEGFCRSLHAEHVSLLRRQHYDRLAGRLTLFTARRLADGSVGNSRPCPNCIALARLAGVKRIFYHDSQRVVQSLSL